MIRVPCRRGLGESPVMTFLVVKEIEMKAAFDATVLRQIESELRTIKAEYAGRVPEESIDRAADESLERLSSSRVPQFVPLFVGRFTRERLRELVASGERPQS